MRVVSILMNLFTEVVLICVGFMQKHQNRKGQILKINNNLIYTVGFVPGAKRYIHRLI